MHTAAVALIVADGSLLRVLPTKNLPRPKKRGRGMTKGLSAPWDCPGGKLRAGETARAAMIREVREETGLNVATVKPTSQHVIAEAKCVVFVLELPGQAAAAAGSGIDEIEWTPIDRALSGATYRLDRALAVARETLHRLQCTCTPGASPCTECSTFQGVSPM